MPGFEAGTARSRAPTRILHRDRRIAVCDDDVSLYDVFLRTQVWLAPLKWHPAPELSYGYLPCAQHVPANKVLGFMWSPWFEELDAYYSGLGGLDSLPALGLVGVLLPRGMLWGEHSFAATYRIPVASDLCHREREDTGPCSYWLCDLPSSRQ